MEKNRFRLYLSVAAATILWERLWPRLWPAAAVAGLFVSLSLLDFLPRLSGWLHGLIVLIFAAGFLAALFHGLRGMRRVDRAAARHRLEMDSGLEHRPLSALEDSLAGGCDDETAKALWRAHLARMAEAARKLRPRLPAPGMARHDPLGLRAVVLLLLVIGLSAAGGDAPARLKEALTPNLGGVTKDDLILEVWITPPPYTKRPPLFLGGAPPRAIGKDTPLETPAGSAVLAQAGGAATAPVLRLGGRVSRFTAAGPGVFSAETTIETGDRLSVELGMREIAGWPLRVIADTPPKVSLVNPPVKEGSRLLRVQYQAQDDYGVTAISAIIRLDGGDSEELRLALPLGKMAETSIRGSFVRDLTAHPWAGLPVSIRLEAADAAGGKGESGAVNLVLPERIFTHPVAKAIIEARKKLSDPFSKGRAQAADDLDTISAEPERFSGDTVVYLALRVARERLTHDPRDEAVDSVRKILWDTALRLEDDGLSIAEKELRKIQEQLMQALRDGKGGEEVERLMERMQQALNDYLSTLNKQLEQMDTPTEFLDPSARVLSGGDLQRLLDQARELARTGAMDSARDLMSELQRILDDIQAGIQPGKPSREMAEARELMEDLRKLSNRQQKLLDDTFRQSQENRGAENGKAEQEALRGDLGEIMSRLAESLGDIPRSLGDGELAMREAEKALGKGQPRAALPSQSEALQKLRQGIEETAKQLARRMGGAGSIMTKKLGGAGRDPFGRLSGGPLGSIGGSLDIPDRMDVREARKILGELRRRFGDRRRPKAERDYIERLLRRF